MHSEFGEWLRMLLPRTLVSSELLSFDPLTCPFLTGWLTVLHSCRLSSPLVLLRIRPARLWLSFGRNICECRGVVLTGGACPHRPTAPSSCCSSIIMTIQTPIWLLPPSKGVQWIHLLRPSSLVLETHLTLAVTPRP